MLSFLHAILSIATGLLVVAAIWPVFKRLNQHNG
jgi:hypothetical protein